LVSLDAFDLKPRNTMSTIEGVVAAMVVVFSFVGVAVAVVVRRAAGRTPSDLDPRHDDRRSR